MEDGHLYKLEVIPICSLLCILSNIFYFTYRVKCILNGQAQASELELLVGWTFIFIELGVALPAIPTYVMGLAARGKLKNPKMLRLQSNQFPTLDVFVPCCGEDLDVILDTTRAAAALDYLNAKFRVVVLDDGDSAEVQKKVTDMRIPNVFYTARKVKVNTHSKAGNTNHGLDFVNTLPGCPSEFIAVLDVDMIPLTYWLRALIPHILQDPKVVMENPPQRFYNLPDGDPLGQSMDFVFDVLSYLQDALDLAWCIGTGWVAQRSAIEQIRGIPTEAILEDVLTSVLLNARGWKAAYVHENLQWGLVPDNFAGWVKQTRRWTSELVGSAAFPRNSRIETLPASQRWNTRIGGLLYGFQIFNLSLCLVVLPALLFSGPPFIVYNTPQQLISLLRFGFLQFLTTWLYGFVMARISNHHLKIFPSYHQTLIYLVPYHFMTLLRLVGENFTPMGRKSDGERKQQAKMSSNILQQMKVMLCDQGAIMHILFVAACILGAWQCRRSAFQAVGPHQGFVKEILIRVAWSPALVLCTTIAVHCWTPISHAISPPAMWTRESLLVRDQDTKVAYPTEEAKSIERVQVSQHYALLTMGYFSFLFLASWLL